jgi:hypothetical protein
MTSMRRTDTFEMLAVPAGGSSASTRPATVFVFKIEARSAHLVGKLVDRHQPATR